MARDQDINQAVGERVIDSLVAFARQKIPTPSELSQKQFLFVTDEKLRAILSETLYGAMWVYRVGKVLASNREELQAHLRTQLINYGAICEAILEYTILHGAKRKVLKGENWKYRDEKRKIKLNWGNPPANLPRETNFAWCIRVSTEEQIIKPEVEKELTKLREIRNTIHLSKKAAESIDHEPKQSKEAFELTTLVVDQSRDWLTSIATDLDEVAR
jgi:hypothetical protein